MSWETGYFWQLDPIIIRFRSRAYAGALYCSFLFGGFFSFFITGGLCSLFPVYATSINAPSNPVRFKSNASCYHLGLQLQKYTNLQIFSSSCTMYINTVSPNMFSNIQPLPSQCECQRTTLYCCTVIVGLCWNATLSRNDLVY